MDGLMDEVPEDITHIRYFQILLHNFVPDKYIP